jgi:hypothetical protein
MDGTSLDRAAERTTLAFDAHDILGHGPGFHCASQLK